MTGHFWVREKGIWIGSRVLIREGGGEFLIVTAFTLGCKGIKGIQGWIKDFS